MEKAGDLRKGVASSYRELPHWRDPYNHRRGTVSTTRGNLEGDLSVVEPLRGPACEILRRDPEQGTQTPCALTGDLQKSETVNGMLF